MVVLVAAETHNESVKLSDTLAACERNNRPPLLIDIEEAQQLEAMLDWLFENCEITYDNGGRYVVGYDDLKRLATD